MEQILPSMYSFSIIIPALESHYPLNFSHLKSYILFFFLWNFSETVRAEEEDQVGPQAPEDPHDSSTSTSPTLPYSSNSPRPFPPSPVHSVTDSPIRVSPLFIAINNSFNNNSPIQGSIGHNSPAPVPSTSPVATSFQIFTSIPSSQITDPSNNLLHTSHLPSSFPLTGPIVFPGGPPEFPYLGVPLPGTSSTPSGTVSLPSYPIPSMIVPATKSIPLLPIESQPISGFGHCRRRGRGSRGIHPGRGRVPRGRRGRATSTTSCQTSPIPSYLWPGYQPSLVPSRGPPSGAALNLVLYPELLTISPVIFLQALCTMITTLS